MRYIKAILLLTAASVLVSVATSEAIEVVPVDIGGCYSVQPLCLFGKPVCVCTIALECWWGCK
jgi:hypothetical protein